MADIFTQEQYTALCAAIAQGVLKVEYGDKKIEYRSLNEMMRIKTQMENALGIGKRRTKYAQHSKGLE
jgi:hypothetical protein